MFGYVSNTLTTLFYSGDTSALFDSITVHNSQGIPWDTLTVSDETKVYEHVVYPIGGDIHTEYIEYDQTTGLPTLKFSIVKDHSGKVIEQGRYVLSTNGISTSGYTYLIDYNSQNKPDSIYYESYSTNYSTKSYSLFQYDNADRLFRVQVFKYENGNWIPSQRITHSYADDVLPYSSPLQILDYGYRSVFDNLIWLLPYCDLDYPSQSINCEQWNGSTWVGGNRIYWIHFSGQSIVLSYDDVEYWGENSDIYFSASTGLYSYIYSSGGDGEVYSTTSIGWESYVPNNDDTMLPPSTASIIRLYPNPFSSFLQIKTNNQLALDDISIYNIKGQLILSWKDVKAAELTWDGRDSNNHTVNSGVYLIRAKQGQQNSTAKVIKF